MQSKPSGLGRKLFWAWVVLLAVLHQDFWWWDDKTMVFGFLPIGLAYHGLFSIVAGVTWLIAIKVAWPVEIEEWASELEGRDDQAGGAR